MTLTFGVMVTHMTTLMLKYTGLAFYVIRVVMSDMNLIRDSMNSLLLKFNLAALFTILIGFNLADAMTTSILVNQYGAGIEINPILRDLIEVYGVGALFGFKYFLISLLGILLLALKTARHIMVAQYSLWFVNFIYGSIVTYNTILVVLTINT